MYKYDLHVHTAEVSPCGKVKAEEVVASYKEAGYDGIVITDHFHSTYFEEFPDTTWEEKVDIFFKGYHRACQVGKKINLQVFPGLEIRFPENLNDYLVFGLDKEYIKEHNNLCKMELKEFKKLIANTNSLIYQAHPFRDEMILVEPALLDGVEVFNGNMRQNSRNDQAYLFAQRNKLKMMSGSDFHQPEDLGQGGIILTEKIMSVEDLIKHLKEINSCKNMIIESSYKQQL